MYNLETYVDPSKGQYYTKVDAEKIKELVPKELYAFNSNNRNTGEDKTYYLWINKEKDDFNIVDIIPEEKENKAFYARVKQYLPSYKFSKYVPSVKKVRKRTEPMLTTTTSCRLNKIRITSNTKPRISKPSN
uniref:Uncharacterized protein n=1 Tax=Chryseobacterium endophyticum TaxID=1854762 RepID=A0AAU6WT01_9FLAO